LTEFKKTKIQVRAIKDVLSSPATHNMLYGGSRSGKTFITIYSLIIRACKFKSRQVILRLNFNHCKTSIWLDTLPKVLKIAFPDLPVEWNKTDYFITLPNGSEIWIGGLDDEARVEKILGKEYSTIYFNECSQIPYTSIQVALTRLAEKSGLKNKAYYDENPPTKRHWSYWLFIKKVEPIESKAIRADNYQSILMNPVDNLENINDEYLDILNSLDERQKARFLLGEFLDGDEGNVYYAFDREKNVKEIDEKVKVGQIRIGMDFNVNPMTATISYYTNGIFYVFDEIYLNNSDTFKMANELKNRGYIGTIYPDSTGANRKTSGKSDHEILRESGFYIESTRNPFVTDRVNNFNRLLGEGRVIISPKCKMLINDLEKVVWKGKDLDEGKDKSLTHISDALGYTLWSLSPIGLKGASKVEIY
jgi:PBSX family phage terminase large subunit